MMDLSLQEALAKAKALRWKYCVNRNEAPLMSSFTENSYRNFEAVTGIPWTSHNILRLANGDLMHQTEELEALQSYFQTKGVPAFLDLKERLVRNVRRFEDKAKAIEELSFRNMPPQKLQEHLSIFIMEALSVHAFLLPLPIADKPLTALLLQNFPPASKIQQEQWLSTLVYPEQEHDHVKEQRSFLQLVMKTRSPDFSALLQEHTKRFRWIGARWYWWKYAWKEQDVEERVKEYLSSGKNAEEELAYLETIKQQQKKAAEELSGKLQLPQEAKQLLDIAKEYAYLRTWRTDVVYRSGYRAHQLFYEIAKRAGLREEEVVYLTYEEVQRMAKEGKLPIPLGELEQRKEAKTNVVLDGCFHIFSGKEAAKKFEDIFQQPQKTSALHGTTAFPGKAQGKVVVVRHPQDISRVRPGDILVAVMTFPHFIAAMEKAAAFVTDEGGILCHAAIVAREMKKPCVIGTKIAAQILKDGDMVEVDAGKGVVKIVYQCAESYL